MTQNRLLYFKIEKLNSSEIVLDEMSVKMTSGKIDVGAGGNRRKCSFTLLEPLPDDWQSYRWKLYYGYAPNTVEAPVYYPLGVFIPINPSEDEIDKSKVTDYQGVDKTKLYSDFEIDAPVTFEAGTTVEAIIKEVAGWFNETKFNIESIGTIEVARTFEEGTTAEQILNTVVTSFSADWYYDVNGILVAKNNIDPNLKPVRYVMDGDNSLYITSSKDIDDGNYYNKVTVVGGTTDTPIYRATLQNDDAIALAGGRIVQKYFTIDGAVTQAQVDGRAAYYLSGGVQLPSKLKLTNLVLPDLELGDIISKDGAKYEVNQFDIPLDTGSQSIQAGKVF